MNKIVALVGPTAVGKTKVSLQLAKELGCEIVCLDSMLVYKYFDIGTAKPTKAEQQQTPHHVLDLIEADQYFTAADYVEAADCAIEKIIKKGKMPLLVGGTGFYLKALEQGMAGAPQVDAKLRAQLEEKIKTDEGRAKMYNMLKAVDAASAQKIPIQNTYRIIRALEVFLATAKPFSAYLDQQCIIAKWDIVKIGLSAERAILDKRIKQRTRSMIDQGLIDEVTALKKKYSRSAKPFHSVGYKEALALIEHNMDLTEMETKVNISTRQLAKRQVTWFKKDKKIQWFEPNKLNKISTFVRLHL